MSIIPGEFDTGRRVKFTGYMHPNAEQPEGILVAFSATTGFVRFDGKKHSEPCDLEYLEWLN